MTIKPKIDVVAGVLTQENTHILLTERPSDKSWSGYWEFPGGKIELLESPEQALIRELKEEINISIINPKHLLTLHHEYDSYSVKLMVFTITQWKGEIMGLENQQTQWVDIKQAQKHPRLLPTTLFILDHLYTNPPH